VKERTTNKRLKIQGMLVTIATEIKFQQHLQVSKLNCKVVF